MTTIIHDTDAKIRRLRALDQKHKQIMKNKASVSRINRMSQDSKAWRSVHDFMNRKMNTAEI